MPRKSHPAVTSLLWLAVAGLGLVTVLAKLGRLSWIMELFAHFPAQYAACLLVTILLAVLLRQWRPAAAATLVLIPNVIALSYYLPTRSEKPNFTPDLRVLTFNVLTSNPARGPVRDYLTASNADLILVVETDRSWLDDLAPLRKQYPHVAQYPRPDNFGMALFSRHPIRSHDFEIAASSLPCLSAIVEVDGIEIQVIGGHPLPPVGRANAAARNRYLEALVPLVRESGRPTIVLGDFNATVWSPFFRKFLKESSLQDTGHKRGLQATWRREQPPFAIPIDHILHSNDLVCTSRRVGPKLGSDHRPVIAELALRER